MQEKFWWNDPRSLVTVVNWKQFVPRGPVNVHYLNSLARFILYFGILSWLYFRRSEIIILTLIGMFVTVIIYKRLPKKEEEEEEAEAEAEEEEESARENFQVIKSTQYERTASTSKNRDYSNDKDEDQPCYKVNQINLIGQVNNKVGNEVTNQVTNQDERYQIPIELFDPEQGKIELKTLEDDKIISKSIETNGLPNDNQPNMGVLPTFDLRPGSNSKIEGGFDQTRSLLLTNPGSAAREARGNYLGSLPAPISSVWQDAFKMGDRLGDNIRRDPDVHSVSIDLTQTPNNRVCGNPNLLLLDQASPSGTCGPCKYNEKTPCQMTSPNNPFGNVLPTDNVGNPGRGPSCLYRDDTDNKWTLAASPFAAVTGSLASGGHGLFRNVDDVWDRNNGQMSFNTLPSTMIPNDRDSYQKWLYHTPYVCKDGDMEACYAIDEMQTRKAGQILQ